MHGRRTTAAALLALTGLTAPTAALAVPTPAPAEPVSATATQRSAADRAPLTPEQVRAQVAQAKELSAQLKKDDAALAEASARLAALAARSNALMSTVTQARTAQRAAEAKERAEVARLEKLTAEVSAARADLQDMAVDAYVNGPGLLRDVAAVLDIVTDGGNGADAAVKADYLSGARAADREKYERLAAAQRTAATQAAAARAAREKATAQAEKAQRQAAAAVAEQQRSVVSLQKLTDGRRAELEKLGVERGMVAGVDLATLETMAVTPLCTEEKGTHPNGMWPATALCPLADAPGHMLRPSAARAFDALSAAYRKAHGTNLCITDSYRSLAAQIDVRRRKPTLAAVPGTSNHGLGLAVDLCGGIESFGTAQHVWMQQHAPLFGFYHPAWAQAGGSKPEPWHWEYIG